MLEKMIIDTAEKLRLASQSMPKIWDGRESILEMRDIGFKYWRQVEWIEFYFKFLCQKHFAGIIDMSSEIYKNTRFDAFREIPWDFKAQAANTVNYNIITNDVEGIADAINTHGYYGIILAIGDVEYDETKTFKKWHDKLRKDICEYETNRINRGVMSRTRKTAFVLEEIHFICFDGETLRGCCGLLQDSVGRTGSNRLKRGEIIVDIRKIPDASLIAKEIFPGKVGL
ncbi:hypothetical protein C6499_19585 [Candidatus Poribacteria bacterium]|nr:MAG: hypothetical protein C6499_19585 [Candidatus Poribacteria bacterium]